MSELGACDWKGSRTPSQLPAVISVVWGLGSSKFWGGGKGRSSLDCLDLP